METSTAAAPGTTDVCPQCGHPANWKASSWCGECGYYPAIGRLIDAPPDVAEEQIYDNVWEAVPMWLWILASGVLGLAVTSILVRIAFAPGPFRFWWTLLQMSGGLTAFMLAHLLAYLHGASRSDKVGPMDAVMKPIATWQPVFRSLPQKSNLVWAGTWGIWALVLAYFVVDGIDYQALAEAKRQAAAEEERERTNPMAAIIGTAQHVAKAQDQLPKHGQAGSLEDALGDFTGEVVRDDTLAGAEGEGLDGALVNFQDGVGVDPENPGASDGEPGAEGSGSGPGAEGGDADGSLEEELVVGTTKGPSRAQDGPAGTSGGAGSSHSEDHAGELIECMVIGYTTNAEGDPRSLLLAAPDRRGLHFVAKVPMENVAPAAQRGLKERFFELHQRVPVVYSPYGGRWLKPRLFCEVRYQGWTSAGRLNEPYITQFAVMGRPAETPPKSASTAR